MLLNFLVDFLLLFGTNRLAGFPTEGKRLIVAAALGGLYSGMCMLPGFPFMGNLIWRVITLAGMGSVAFGWNRSTLKRIGIYLILSMALGGIAVSFTRADFGTIVLSALCVWLLCRVAFGGHVGEREYVPLELAYGEKKVTVLALQDSGNTLRDPVTGEQVLVISAEVATRLTGLTEAQLKNPLETLAMQPVPGLRLIPYQAVGKGNGMLLAMRFSYVKIGSRVQRAVVAFAPEGLGKGEVYQALTGGTI